MICRFFQNFQCCNCDFDLNPLINMLLSKFQRKTNKQKKKKERERKTEIYYFYQFIMTPYFHLKKKSLYTTHVLHLPIYYISHLFNHFTTTIYLPILLQQFLLVLLCIVLPFIHLLYFNCIFDFLLLQNMYFFFLSELGD